MDSANLRLSAEEAELVKNAGWILTKNNILQKAEGLLSQLQEEQAACLATFKDRLPIHVSGYSPKLSRGENYQGLPYRVLDYPRLFEQQDILTIRGMFWWGHFFSSTLLVAGRYCQQYRSPLLAAYDIWASQDYYVCTHPHSPWEHHFDKSNYMPVKEITRSDWEQVINRKPFIKLARRYHLDEWEKGAGLLLSSFRQYLAVLCS